MPGTPGKSAHLIVDLALTTAIARVLAVRASRARAIRLVLRCTVLAIAFTVAVGLLGLAPAARAADNAKLVLVLDSSGSMKEKVGGASKISIAKKALNTVVGGLPAGASVGLRVYGATVFNRRDKGACTDSQLVVPIGTGNRAALRSEIKRYKPYGETPISYALTQAAGDLGASGKRTVVLVSDGEETCDADPCETAAALSGKGIDLKFDVIGLRVSGQARNQLRCIADKGHGTYYDADNAAQIEASLEKLATRAFRPFQLTGVPIDGSLTKRKAPLVAPGQYLDQLPGQQEQPLYYRIPRTTSGSTIRASATARVKGSTSAVSMTLTTPDGGYCTGGVGIGYQGLSTAEVSSWRSDPASPCNTADELLASVDAPVADLVGATFELVVAEEPPVVSERHLPPVEKPTWQKMKLRSPIKAPVAGTALSDAPTLAPGTYRGSILTGETQVYAVDLDWGQRLQVQLEVPPQRGRLRRELIVGDTLLVQLLGAMRGRYVNLDAEGQPEDTITWGRAKTYVDAETSPTIRYLNRTSFDTTEHGAFPGRQYVVLSKNNFVHKKPFLVPYTLGIKVIGTAGEGAPQYVEGTASPTPTPSASPSPTAGPATPLPQTPPTTPPGVSLGVVVAVGAGALIFGVAGAAAVLAVRRRRRRH